MKKPSAPTKYIFAILVPVALLLTAFGAFWVWFSIASNYDYDALSGLYSSRENGVRCTVRLRSDGTFYEELVANGHTRSSNGTWRRIGEGGAEFANLLPYPDHSESANHAQLGSDDSKETYAEFVKVLTVYPKLEVRGYPVLRKRIFTH